MQKANVLCMNRSNPPTPAEGCVPPDKTPTQEPDDPFATFSEWSDEADEKAYERIGSNIA